MNRRHVEKNSPDKMGLGPEENAAIQVIAQRIALGISRDIASALSEMLVLMRSVEQRRTGSSKEILPDSLLTAADMARLLKISKSKAYEMMRRQDIPTIIIGRTVRVRRDDLERFIDRQTAP